MHTLMKVTMNDFGAANQAITEGKLPKLFEKIDAIIKPEASFFYTEEGFRTALFIFDMKDASQIPHIAEPFFIELNAKVQFFPAMDRTELMRGLDVWNKEAPSYSSLS